MSQAAIIGVVVLMMMMSSSVGAVALMMGGDDGPSSPGPSSPGPSSSSIDSRISKSTPENVFAEGSLIHLDRHDITCGASQGISGFTLKKVGNDKMKYDYKCLDIPGGALGPRKDTGPQEWGDNSVIVLDRQHLDCGKNAIAEFGLYRPADDKLSYEYKCSTKEAAGTCREVDAVSPTKTDTIKIDTLLDLNPECAKDEVMTKFRYYRAKPDTADETGAYKYTCCKLT
jgi:hypothetical protein